MHRMSPPVPTELTIPETKAQLASRETHLQGFLHGSGFTAASLVFNGVLGMVTAMVFARWLKPEAFGTYSIAVVSITLLGGLGAAGMDTTVARFVAFYSGSGDRDLIKPVLRFGIRWALIISVALAAVSYAFLAYSSWIPPKLDSLRSVAVYVGLAIPLFAVSLVLLQAILHLGAIRTRMVLEKGIQPLLRLALPFAAALLLRNRLSAAVAGVLMASLIGVFFAGVVLHRITATVPSGAAPGRENVRTWSGYALPFAFQSLQQFISGGLGVDILMVGLLLSMSASGVYAAAFRLTLLITLVRSAMDYAFGPRVSALFGRSDLHSIDVLYKASSMLGLVLAMPFGIVLILFSRPVMTVAFGSTYGDGATALAWLVAGCVVDSATGCNTTLLAMVGRSWLVLANGIVGGVLTVLLCWLLVPRFGIAGAAFSVTAARVCVNALAAAELWKLQRLQPFAQSALRVVVPGISAAVVGFCFRNYFVVPAFGAVGSLAFSVAAVLAVYLAALRLAGVQWPQMSGPGIGAQ
jgi:O-antigen/teichoic acid export membrane protein